MKNRNIPLPSEAAAAGSARRFLVETVAAAVGSFWSIAGGAVVVLFLAVLILLDVPSWAASAADGWTAGAGEAVLDVVRSIGGQLRAYFAVHALLAACAGVIEAAFLWAIGVDFAPLWGLLVFVFSFVPNFGAFVASGPPVLLAWVSLGWEWALAVGAGLTAIEVLLGNVAAPFVEGRRLIVSPLTVLASVVFWTWMWGPAGAFLAAPLTASMVVVMAHVESTRPFALMLSRRTEMERLLADALQQQAAT